MTDQHSAEFFNNAHFWVVMFVIYNLPMQQGNQKIQYSMEMLHFLFHLYRYVLKHVLHYDHGIPFILL